MAKGRWTKYGNTNKFILEIFGKNDHLTTNSVKQELKDKYNVVLSWLTVQNYLNELHKSNHISLIVIQKENKLYLWKKKNFSTN